MSLSKNELKDIKSLATKKGRKAQNSFLAEGVRVLEEALRSQARPDLIVWAPSVPSDRVRRLVDSFQRAGVPCEEVSAREMQSITDAREAQPIAGRFTIDWTALGQLFGSESRRVLICDRISDPGNLGTLIRSALAFEFDRIVLVGEAADPFSPKVVRSSAGAIFGVKMTRSETGELLDQLAATGFKLIGATADNNGQLALEPTDRVALAIGSEAAGLADELKKRCNELVRLRHSNRVESLNAAMAGSILMQRIYETEAVSRL